MVLLFYITKLILACGIFYSYYWLFLRNQQFHRYNRFYLLITTSLSIVIPFLKIPVGLFSSNPDNAAFVKTLRVIAVNEWEEPVTIYASRNNWSHLFNMQNGFILLYATGVIIGLFFLIRSLLYVLDLKRKYPQEVFHHIKFYNTTEKGTPFSFFRAIFWNREIPFDTKQGQQIFRHEFFHVKEKHSADIMLLELLCCLGWFNPFFHLLKKEIKAIHEFLADAYAVSLNNRHEYAELLVLHAIHQKKPGLTNQFFHNQIKRRINMIIHSNLVRRNSYLSRMMALPLLFVLVSAFAIKLTNKQVNNNHSSSGKTLTVIIDAGHGGIDNGTINENGIVEKNLNLAIAQKIKELSTGFNVSVELTRNSDELPGNAFSIDEGLSKRIEITKEKKADLFVSIHVNAIMNIKKAAIAKIENSGFEVYVTSKKENEKSKLLGISILSELKNIYFASETIKQREVGIRVLDENSCPAIILECGYINNPKDLSFITDKYNQEKIARNILEGIVKYSREYNLSVLINKDTIPKSNKENADSSVKMIVDVKMTAEENLNAPTHQFDTTFIKVEFEPQFPGGQAAWIKFLHDNLKYPKAALDKEIQGTVLMQFIVDKTGKTSDVKAISGPEALKKECIRIIETSGNWVPGKDDGKNVKVYKKQPITFRLQ